MEKFQVDAINIWTALKKFQTDDASRSNSERKISNGWCHQFERQTKNFERMMPAVRTPQEKFRTDDATSSNDKRKISNGYWKISSRWCQPFEQLKKYLEHIIPGIRTAEEKDSYWTTSYKRLSG